MKQDWISEQNVSSDSAWAKWIYLELIPIRGEIGKKKNKRYSHISLLKGTENCQTPVTVYNNNACKKHAHGGSLYNLKT